MAIHTSFNIIIAQTDQVSCILDEIKIKEHVMSIGFIWDTENSIKYIYAPFWDDMHKVHWSVYLWAVAYSCIYYWLTGFLCISKYTKDTEYGNMIHMVILSAYGNV